MTRTKLVVVEGIMGSGKSITSRFLLGQMRRAGIPAARYGNPSKGMRHPPDELRRMLRELPDRRLVWRRLGPEELMDRSLEAWHRFVAEAARSEEVCVFDGRWFNGDFCGLMMMDVPASRLRDHLLRVAEIARPLSPRLIYLHPADVQDGLRRIARIRGRGWLDSQVGWKVASPYCRFRGLDGLEGWLELYSAYRDLCERLMGELELPARKIDVSSGDWSAIHREMLDFLGLRPSFDPGFRLWRLSKAPRIWLSRMLGNLERAAA